MDYILVTILFVVGSAAAPVDDPVRIELPVYDQPLASSDVLESQTYEPENYPGGESRDQAAGGNFVSYKLQAASNLLGNKLHTKSLQVTPHGSTGFYTPLATYETAVVESEGYGSKALSIKENLHHIVAGLFQPKPIVDTISESEKYGNTGDKFYGAGQALVGGAEGVSNLINSVLEVPGTIFKKITRTATEKLNNLGGKLIGL